MLKDVDVIQSRLKQWKFNSGAINRILRNNPSLIHVDTAIIDAIQGGGAVNGKERLFNNLVNNSGPGKSHSSADSDNGRAKKGVFKSPRRSRRKYW